MQFPKIFYPSKFSSPDEGLEPATLRLKVWCSTDWANRACVISKPETTVRLSIFESQNCWLATGKIWKWLPLYAAKTSFWQFFSWGLFSGTIVRFKLTYLSQPIFHRPHARLAQSVEHQTFNLRVAGSSPSSGHENFLGKKFSEMASLQSFMSR